MPGMLGLCVGSRLMVHEIRVLLDLQAVEGIGKSG